MLLDSLSDFFIQIDVEVAVAREDRAFVFLEESDHSLTEATLWVFRITFHEQHDFVLGDKLLDSLLEAFLDVSSGDLFDEVSCLCKLVHSLCCTQKCRVDIDSCNISSWICELLVLLQSLKEVCSHTQIDKCVLNTILL